jgi:hypothetical protein
MIAARWPIRGMRMTRHPCKTTNAGAVTTGAAATGASATGAASLAAMAMGALAVGAVAVGALAIGRLRVGRALLQRVEIGELAVGRMEVGGDGIAGRPVVVCRIRAAEGQGDALEALLRDEVAAGGTEPLPVRVLRSATEPGVFVLQQTLAHAGARQRPTARISAIVRRAAEEGLVSLPATGPVEVELLRTI